ncbi:MAG: hypothetical protein GEU94_15165 [Micromonosporaceae bacterium]|nr:hypothetical protein [Micromonosporaceae bacterium]
MKAIGCLLFIPAAIAVWVLGSPQTAWRVYTAFRKRGPKGEPPSGVGNTLIRAGATLALFSVLIIGILIARSSD